MSSSADRQAREQQQERLTAFFDVALSVLALVFLGLFVLELTASLREPWASLVSRGQLLIWAIFVGAFVVELSVAPSKRRYLRHHWLVALSLALPLFRIFRVVRGLRVLRSTRALRGVNVARTLTTTNRALRSLADLAYVTQFAYLVMVTGVVTIVSAAAVPFFERGAADSTITSFGEGLWWAAALVTTVGSSTDPVTLEGRVLAVLLRLYGLVVFGYLTARLAVYFLGGSRREGERQQTDLAQLRAEIQRLAELIEADAGPEHRPNGTQRRERRERSRYPSRR